jgi:hypothetical protein
MSLKKDFEKPANCKEAEKILVLCRRKASHARRNINMDINKPIFIKTTGLSKRIFIRLV